LRSRLLRDLLLVAAPVALIMALAPFGYGNQLLLFNFVMFLALAQGLNIIYGFTGYLPFGYVGFFGAGAYGFAIAVLQLHWPPVAALLAAGAASVLLGLVLTPLLRLSGAYFAIANLAASQAVYQVVSNPDLEWLTRGPYGITLSGVYAPTASYAAAVVILAGALALVAVLRNSRFGLALQAIKDDPGRRGLRLDHRHLLPRERVRPRHQHLRRRVHPVRRRGDPAWAGARRRDPVRLLQQHWHQRAAVFPVDLRRADRGPHAVPAQRPRLPAATEGLSCPLIPSCVSRSW